jgi:DNA-binding XRE family transcriptional regulator
MASMNAAELYLGGTSKAGPVRWRCTGGAARAADRGREGDVRFIPDEPYSSRMNLLSTPMPRRQIADPVAARIGHRIRALRESQGLTQEKLAYEAGLKSKGHLSGIEKGLVRPTLQTLAVLAERLEVDLLDLLTFPEESPRQRLVDLTRQMSPGTIRRLVRDAGG